MKIEHVKYDRWQFPLSVVLQFKQFKMWLNFNASTVVKEFL